MSWLKNRVTNAAPRALQWAPLPVAVWALTLTLLVLPTTASATPPALAPSAQGSPQAPASPDEGTAGAELAPDKGEGATPDPKTVPDPPKHTPTGKMKLRRPPAQLVKARRAKASKGATQADKDAIEARIRGHIQRANDHELEAYLADFTPGHSKIDLIREYSARVFEEHAPSIEIVEFEIRKVSRSSGAVRVVQRSQWTDKFGNAREALTQITYRMRKKDDAWWIDSTGRSLIAPGAAEDGSDQPEDTPEETDAPASDDEDEMDEPDH